MLHRPQSRQCLECDKYFTTERDFETCYQCRQNERVSTYERWTETGVFCYISRQFCELCDVGKLLEVSDGNGCQQPKANQQLLAKKEPLPDNWIRDAHLTLDIIGRRGQSHA